VLSPPLTRLGLRFLILGLGLSLVFELGLASSPRGLEEDRFLGFFSSGCVLPVTSPVACVVSNVSLASCFGDISAADFLRGFSLGDCDGVRTLIKSVKDSMAELELRRRFLGDFGDDGKKSAHFSLGDCDSVRSLIKSENDSMAESELRRRCLEDFGVAG